VSYENHRRQILDEIELLRTQTDLAATKVIIRTRETATVLAINVIDLIQKKIKENAEAAAQKSKDIADATAEGIPKAVGLANDVGAPARSGIKMAGNIASFALTAIKLIASGGRRKRRIRNWCWNPRPRWRSSVPPTSSKSPSAREP